MTQFEKSVNRCVYDFDMSVQEAKDFHKKCFVWFIGLPRLTFVLKNLYWKIFKGAKLDWNLPRWCFINRKWYNISSNETKWMKLGWCYINQFALDEVDGFKQGNGNGKKTFDIFERKYLKQLGIARVF